MRDTPNCPRTERAIEIAGAGAKTHSDVLKGLAVNLEALCRQLEIENAELRREVRDAAQGAATEERWKAAQGEEYGSY